MISIGQRGKAKGGGEGVEKVEKGGIEGHPAVQEGKADHGPLLSRQRGRFRGCLDLELTSPTDRLQSVSS